MRQPRVVPWIDWTCPLVSVELWREVGPFDEKLPGYYAEIDWCYRAYQAGCRFGVCDWLQVTHLGSVTAQRVGHVWDADDAYLRAKWGKGWIDLVGEMTALMEQRGAAPRKR
jgi:GT2 family glycosyltransferase